MHVCCSPFAVLRPSSKPDLRRAWGSPEVFAGHKRASLQPLTLTLRERCFNRFRRYPCERFDVDGDGISADNRARKFYGAADHAARGTDAVKQELHALCAGSSKTVVTVECYPGTDQAEILALFPHAELIIHADDLAIQPAELDAKIEHELTDDPVFGIMTTWQMKNFYPEEALCAARGKIDAVTDGLVLVYGVGASLVERADITIYADITRWEIQLRFRKGQDNWHTAMHDLPQRAKYKRGYFAEWRWGDRIKDKLLPVFDYYLDTTSAGDPAIVPGAAYREALSKAAAQPFRMVPYFDPGVWGGDWMKTHFDLPENGSNYAWLSLIHI